jgi:outer membrane usher protein FimD/PapC
MTEFNRCRNNMSLSLFRLNSLYASIILGLTLSIARVEFSIADDIQFNTDVLDVKDRGNIDLSHFARAGYIMPGTYPMTIHINRDSLPVAQVSFYSLDNDPKSSVACLTPEMIKTLGMKERSMDKITWWHNGQCAALESIPGMTATGDLGQSTLFINVPQAYMEFSSDTWDPPSRWDNGVPGLLFDYNINADRSTANGGDTTQELNGTGTAGANLGPWRARADWQYQHEDDSSESGSALKWTRYYLYRALPSLQSNLTIGQNTMDSQVFDNFQFLGANLASDDSMLPPNTRGYAPEIIGIANSNAKVTVSQQGRVLYETQVPAGPFNIQELSDSVSGKLDVKVEEQNGAVRTWQVDTATIPYLTRPGSIRYSLTAGRPTDWDRNLEGPVFASGELSWGINNGWSAYGGMLGSDGYQSLSLGVGRDLLVWGALSFDITQANASLDNGEQRNGRSYRLSYSKRFDDYDSQITFAGYRFAEKNYMSMSQYLDTLNQNQSDDYEDGSDKEMYTITVNKQFRDAGVSLNLSYNHQTYWDKNPNDNWNLSVARYFDVGNWKDISISFNGYSNTSNDNKDKGMYLSLSVPFGQNNTLSYNGSSGSDSSQTLGWYSLLGRNDSVQLNAGVQQGAKSSISGYYTHEGDIAKTTLSGSHQEGTYTSFDFSASGGVTVTPYGAALHRMVVPGGTRMMVDTGGVSGVPVSGNGSPVKSNIFGKAVITDVNSYYRNTAEVNVADLGDDVEAITSVVEDTLTEGAIGYRKFEVIAGQKLMAVIKLPDGSSPPFGATVTKDGHQTGLVGDNGEVWLSGVEPEGRMAVSWDDTEKCNIAFPAILPTAAANEATLLLPCSVKN